MFDFEGKGPTKIEKHVAKEEEVHNNENIHLAKISYRILGTLLVVIIVVAITAIKSNIFASEKEIPQTETETEIPQTEEEIPETSSPCVWNCSDFCSPIQIIQNFD